VQELEEEVSFSAWLPAGHLPHIRDTLPSGAPSRFAFMKQVCAKALQMMHADADDAMHVGNPRDLALDKIWDLAHDPLPREQAEYTLAIDLSGPDTNPRANAGAAAAAAVAPPRVAVAPPSTAPMLVTPDHDTHQLQRQLLGTLQDADGNMILTIDSLAEETSWDHAHRVVAGLRALKGALANARSARHKEHTPALTKAISALDKAFLSAKRSEIKCTDTVPLTHVRSLLIHCFKTMQQCTRANGLLRQLSSSPHSVRGMDMMHVAVGKMRAVLKGLRVLPFVVGVVAVQGSGKTTVIEILQDSFKANGSKIEFHRENHEKFMPPLRSYLAAMARSAPLHELQDLSHKVQLAVLDAAHQGLSDVGVAGPGAVVERLTTCVMAFGLTALKNGHLSMAHFFDLADTVEKVGFLPSCIWWVDEDPEVCLARVKSRAQADPTRTHEASSGLQYLRDLAVAHELVYGHVSVRDRCTVWTDRLPLMGCKDTYKDTVCRIFGTRIRLHLEAVADARSFRGTDIFAPVVAKALP
jgi:thymidylate kinase